MEFGAFHLAQADITAFPPCRHAFQGLAIINNFNTHMKVLHKSWVLNNSMPDRLHMSSFACLDVMDLYTIYMHLKSSCPREYFIHHGDDLINNVGVRITPTLRP